MVYLPLASQHLDVKTIGRGGPLRRLLKPDKGRPVLRACQRLPVEVAPQVGMSARGAAVFLRVGYVAGHCMASIRLQTRSGDVSVGSRLCENAGVLDRGALWACQSPLRRRSLPS